MGARVGRHVSRSREELVGQLIGECFPLFNRELSRFFPVWDYVPTRFFLLFAGHVGAPGTSDHRI